MVKDKWQTNPFALKWKKELEEKRYQKANCKECLDEGVREVGQGDDIIEVRCHCHSEEDYSGASEGDR